METSVPDIRIVQTNKNTVNNNGDFVLYWMIAYRRAGWNYSLQRAIEWAGYLGKPLLILEALRCDYPWANDRIHRFVLDGMIDTERQLKKYPATYYPYIEPGLGDGKGMLEAIAKKASLIVTDAYPAFFLPRMVQSASRKIPILMEIIDSNGLLPMRAAERVFTTAYSFRRFLQKNLPAYLFEGPEENPFIKSTLPELKKIPEEISEKWPRTPMQEISRRSGIISDLPIDHGVPSITQRGGSREGRKLLKNFVYDLLAVYTEKRNQPQEEATSGLAPYLHFGHISSHQVFHEIIKKEKWFFDRLSEKTSGSRNGWWGMSEPAEMFLDQLITWRELGFNMCWHRNDYDQYSSLPEYALRTLSDHEGDEREHIYSLEEFEQARTHDPLWNAAQNQLLKEGRIHNYLRMLWGKKILEWTGTPETALQIMIEINNRHALDGRDPNSYSGIFWVLGRYDRPWGPERDIFGKVRYMSSKNTARKVRVKEYIQRYSPKPGE